MNKLTNILIYAALLAIFSCKQKYILPAKAIQNAGNLVVEGNISLGFDSTIIMLSRATPVTDTTKIIVGEPGASVIVESDAGAKFPLTEMGNGRYALQFITPGGPKEKYRLNITTANGKQYLSDFVPFKTTPYIDSVSWEQHNDGVHIYVSTHDTAGASQYYRWAITEVFQYHSAWNSIYKYENGNYVRRGPDEDIYNCWQTNASSGILLQSTTNLAQDVVYKKELMFIPTSNYKLSVKYSILVRQSVLTQEGFNYWNGLSKNTESLGSLFDAQPSLLAGNMHCVTNPQEAVIGFISAATTQQQRIFIDHLSVHDWVTPTGLEICDTIHVVHPGDLQLMANGIYIPIDEVGLFQPFYAAPVDCVDCRLMGGTTVKPPFWP